MTFFKHRLVLESYLQYPTHFKKKKGDTRRAVYKLQFISLAQDVSLTWKIRNLVLGQESHSCLFTDTR